MLVPLDGSTTVRAALGPAAEIATASGGEVLLVTIVTAGFERMIDGYAEVEHTTPEQAAAQYLHRVEHDLRDDLEGVEVKQVVRSSEEPTKAIIDIALSEGATMVALTSHGYSGFRQLVLGGVAEEILRKSPLPVLLVPLTEHD